MGHQTENVARFVNHPGDVPDAAVGVLTLRVAKGDPALRLEPVELVVRREVAAAHVLDRDREPLSGRELIGEWSGEVLRDEPDLAADEAQTVIRKQRARKEPGLTENLEAVADPEHPPAVRRELRDRLHGRGEPRDRPGAQIVAIGEPTGDDDSVEPAEVHLIVPDETGLSHPVRRRYRVPLVAGARKLENADHSGALPFPEGPSSITIS